MSGILQLIEEFNQADVDMQRRVQNALRALGRDDVADAAFEATWHDGLCEEMPPALARLIARDGLDARPELAELIREFERDNAEAAGERVCVGCGCTEDDACLDMETGEPCAWMEGYDGNLCSACGRVAVAVVYAAGLVRCSACHGRGRRDNERCAKCGGTGLVESKRVVRKAAGA